VDRALVIMPTNNRLMATIDHEATPDVRMLVKTWGCMPCAAHRAWRRR
jgi:hypothetical protein